MTEFQQILDRYLDIRLIQVVISGARKKEGPSRIKIRPVLIKDTLMFQSTQTVGPKEFHANYGKTEILQLAEQWMSESFRQMQLESEKGNVNVLVSKKGKFTIKGKKNPQAIQQNCCQDEVRRKEELSHNRKKRYILEEGRPVDFLIDLGVMTREGRIVHARYDKFRQINRFLEFVEDILPKLARDREITILDFGCGKSYLTFAMYYYLHELKSYDIRIIGLDLKTDVIRKCNELAKKYQYGKLTFLEGNIADYTGAEEVDMVVTLHACDTATDFALAKAIGWNAKVILSVPCCQHELNRQMKNDVLSPIMNYGLLKERMAALVTDGLRAEYLKREGYDVQVLEFIDMEHTPKNILLRAVKTGRRADNEESIRACETFLRVTPTLGRLLDEKGEL